MGVKHTAKRESCFQHSQFGNASCMFAPPHHMAELRGRVFLKSCLLCVMSILKNQEVLNQLSTDEHGTIPIIVWQGVPSFVVAVTVFSILRTSDTGYAIITQNEKSALFSKSHVLFNHISDAILQYCNTIIAKDIHTLLCHTGLALSSSVAVM